jgi:hypothetical protein
VDHLLSLYIMNNILPCIPKFGYDKKYLNSLMKSKNKKKKKFNQPEFMQFLLNKNIRENFSKYEGKFLAMIYYLLNMVYIGKEGNMLIFTSILKTIMIYGVNQPKEIQQGSQNSNKSNELVRKTKKIDSFGNGSI